MFRRAIQKIIVAGFAAASLTAFAVPTAYAAPAEQSPAQAEQGWCEIVPSFCGKHCGQNARCNPCGPGSQDAAIRNDQQDCVANRE
jgi:hypothetical protein